MKKLAVIFLLLLTLFLFWEINTLNYGKHLQIRDNFVNHPENLPNPEFAKKSSFGFQNLRADLYRLETIQYIGGNAISSKYKKYLYNILDLVTELNPYFSHPYEIGMLLLPDYNQRYEKLNEEQENLYIKQAETLGLKGIKNFCDLEKIKLIKSQDDLRKIWTEEKYKNPCKDSQIPYYLAFIYYFYMHEPAIASDYYKIASANEDALEGNKIMAAIMQGKGGNREKSYFMFLNIAKTLDDKDKVCSTFATKLEEIGALVFTNRLTLNGKLLDDIRKTRTEIFGIYDPDDKKDQKTKISDCGNYINKATREINLEYIEKANEKYKLKNNGKSAKNAKILLDEKYIDYLPIDYQQEKDYGIIYEYNSDTGNFDYDMGNY